MPTPESCSADRRALTPWGIASGRGATEEQAEDLVGFASVQLTLVRSKRLIGRFAQLAREARHDDQALSELREAWNMPRLQGEWIDLTLPKTGHTGKDRFLKAAFEDPTARKKWIESLSTRMPTDQDVLRYVLRASAGLRCHPLWGDPEREYSLILLEFFDVLRRGKDRLEELKVLIAKETWKELLERFDKGPRNNARWLAGNVLRRSCRTIRAHEKWAASLAASRSVAWQPPSISLEDVIEGRRRQGPGTTT